MRSATYFEHWRRTALTLSSEPRCLIWLAPAKRVWKESSRDCSIALSQITHMMNALAVLGWSLSPCPQITTWRDLGRCLQGRLELLERGHLWCVYIVSTNSLAHIHFLWESQNVMPGAHNFTMRDSTFYVAQNVCTVITALMIWDIDQSFCQDWGSQACQHGSKWQALCSPKTKFKCPIYRSWGHS